MLATRCRAVFGASFIASFTSLVAQVTIATVPPSSSVDLAPGQVVNRIVRVCLPGAVPPVAQADVYILADTTGSMGSVLNQVKMNAAAVVTGLLGSGTDLRVGIGNYKDFPFDPYCFQHQLSPTNVQADITTAINAWTAGGGADGSEGQFFALYQVTQLPAIGWRPAAKRILVWFGDAPGHDPVCAAINGIGVDIDEALVISSLQGAGPGGTTVIAISTPTGYPQGLNDDPQSNASNYAGTCTIGGMSGQANRITAATGGLHTFIGAPGAIVTAILNAVGTALLEVDVSLAITGPMAPFITNVTPPVFLNVMIPPDPTMEVCVDFTVEFTGTPCQSTTVFPGQFEALADGAGTGATLPYTVTQGICGPPVCSIIGAPPMGSVGVPIVFTVDATDGDPADIVTLSAIQLPAGAVANPPLPVSGNPASTTITWIPTNAQLGPNVFEFQATDTAMNSSTCSTSIEIAECYALFGFNPTNFTVGGPGDVLYVEPFAWYPVTTVDIPVIQIPNHPGLAGLHVYSQVAMWNPDMFPLDPLHLTEGLDAVLGGGVPTQYGATNGMHIWSNQATPLGGSLAIRFSLP